VFSPSAEVFVTGCLYPAYNQPGSLSHHHHYLQCPKNSDQKNYTFMSTGKLEPSVFLPSKNIFFYHKKFCYATLLHNRTNMANDVATDNEGM